jgi:hypothetical protein
MTRTKAHAMLLAWGIDAGNPSKVVEAVLAAHLLPLTKTERNKNWKEGRNRPPEKDKIVLGDEIVPLRKKTNNFNDREGRNSPSPLTLSPKGKKEELSKLSPSVRRESTREEGTKSSRPKTIIPAPKNILHEQPVDDEFTQGFESECGFINLSEDQVQSLIAECSLMSHVRSQLRKLGNSTWAQGLKPEERERAVVARIRKMNREAATKETYLKQKNIEQKTVENYGRKPKSQSMIEWEAREERKRLQEANAAAARAARSQREQHARQPPG